MERLLASMLVCVQVADLTCGALIGQCTTGLQRPPPDSNWARWGCSPTPPDSNWARWGCSPAPPSAVSIVTGFSSEAASNRPALNRHRKGTALVGVYCWGPKEVQCQVYWVSASVQIGKQQYQRHPVGQLWTGKGTLWMGTGLNGTWPA